MFRLIFGPRDWKWTAYGKHPSASEYLRPKSGTLLQSAVSSWMEQGFELLSEDAKTMSGLSWSFWMKGPNGKMLCGRLSTSSDRFGRVYPLMLVGEGVSGDTENNWDLLPFACQDSWKMLQETALADEQDADSLQSRLKLVEAPQVEWKKYANRREELRKAKIVSGPPAGSVFVQRMHAIDELSRRPVFSLPFDDEHFENYYLPSYKFLALLKTRVQSEPHMVFLGGSEESKSLTVLKFPPKVQDFVMLWENGNRGRRGL